MYANNTPACSTSYQTMWHNKEFMVMVWKLQVVVDFSVSKVEVDNTPIVLGYLYHFEN